MKSRGFTLIEVLIAVGVIGILSAIALPIYRGYVAKAEAASVTVAGLSSNFQSQLDAAESNTGTSNSGTASTPTPPTTAVSTGQTGSTDTSNGDTSAPSNNAVSSTPSTNSGSTEPSTTTTTDSTNTSSTPPPNVSASGSGGGGGNASPSTPTIGVPEAFQDCDPCGIGKKKTVQIAFDLSSFGTLDADSIASGKTGSAITGNPSGQYNADNGQYVVTIRTHDQKSKTGTLSVSVDGQSTTINLKTI